MKKTLLSSIVFLFTVLPAFAQMNGTVVNAKQKAMKRIKVWRKNTTESVLTDDNGYFSFKDLLPSDTLVIPYSKKENAVFAVGQYKNIHVILNKKNFVIVSEGKVTEMNYLIVLRPILSSNILTQEQIQLMSANSLYDIFRSSIPGVTVSEGTTGQQIIIRGGNSFESGLEPLFIIDGAQYESSADADSRIVVNEIEKIEVLKDGGQYGIKGANGVIIITTIGH